MATGKVKWFNNAKGYGFVRPNGGGDDLFVHYSYITMEGYKSLKAGQAITYDVREAPKGHHAINIDIVAEDVGLNVNLVADGGIPVLGSNVEPLIKAGAM